MKIRESSNGQNEDGTIQQIQDTITVASFCCQLKTHHETQFYLSSVMDVMGIVALIGNEIIQEYTSLRLRIEFVILN